jgi:hypothetical protein
MSKPIEIQVKGADILARNLTKFADEIKTTMQAAAMEAGAEVIDSKGIGQYPPPTAANAPPTPYYIRGRGTQYKTYNKGNSERYGTKFYIKREGYGAIIGNSASYAKYLADEKEQASHMATIGWRKLIDVAREKLPKLKNIFDRWVQRLINQLGL